MDKIIWSNFFIELFLLIYFFSIYSQKKIRELYLFLLIIIIYILRDVFFLFLMNNNIIVISDIIVLTVYLILLRTHTGRVKTDIVYCSYNAIIIFLGLIETFINIVPHFHYYISIILIINLFYILSAMLKITEYNSRNADIIINIRYKIFFLYLALYTLFFFLDFDIYFIHNILIPLSYFFIFYLIHKFQVIINEENQNDLYNYSNDLDSLFNFMRNFGNTIKDKLDLNKALEIIVDSAVKNTNADAGSILLVDENSNNLVVRAVSGLFPPVYPVKDIVKVKANSLKSYFMSTSINIGETVLGEAVKKGKSIFIKDASTDKRMENNLDQNLLYISSIIVIPLIVTNRIIGVLSTIKKTNTRFFNERDFSHLETFASYVSISIDNMFTYMEILEKNELQKELGIAAQIQQRLIPNVLPDFQNLSVSVYSKPAKGVSGDYYDIIKLDEDKIAFVICDVAGKGVPAAMVMIMIRTILHLIIFSKKDPAQIISWINSGLSGNIDVDIFATMSLLIFNKRNSEILYTNAGHSPLLIFKKDSNKFFKIDTDGLPIGIEKKSRYGQKRVKINSDDLLVLYTDGIVEALSSDGNQYSTNRMLKRLREEINLDADSLVKKVKEDLDMFVGNNKQHDDQTLLVLKHKDINGVI